MELLQLRYFYESAQNENFAKTAEKFMVPASSVSTSVKRLEQELGVKLFDRSANSIKLNEKGQKFAKSLGEMFGKIECAITDITEIEPEIVQLSILIRARRKWITDLIIEYKESHPDIHFRVFNDFEATDFKNYDLIIDEKSDTYKDLKRFLISVEKICIKASKNSPLAERPILFSELREQPFIMTRKGNGMRKLLENTGKKHGFAPDIAIECNDSYCLSRYVEAGMGLTLGSVSALQERTEKNIVPLNVIDFNEAQSVYAYHRGFKPGDAALKSFCRFLQQKSKI